MIRGSLPWSQRWGLLWHHFPLPATSWPVALTYAITHNKPPDGSHASKGMGCSAFGQLPFINSAAVCPVSVSLESEQVRIIRELYCSTYFTVRDHVTLSLILFDAYRMGHVAVFVDCLQLPRTQSFARRKLCIIHTIMCFQGTSTSTTDTRTFAEALAVTQTSHALHKTSNNYDILVYMNCVRSR